MIKENFEIIDNKMINNIDNDILLFNILRDN